MLILAESLEAVVSAVERYQTDCRPETRNELLAIVIKTFGKMRDR